MAEQTTRIPDPQPTPDGPAYEGRLLTRPHDEVVDQGVAFDLRTLIGRRGVLGLFGLGTGALILSACSTGGGTAEASASASASAGEIPDETAGPYPGDGSNGVDVLEQSGIVRSDIRSSLDGGTTATGVPIALTLTVLDMAGDDTPFAGAAVYVWHCDSGGGYSMYSEGIENETYLRGVQVVDDAGTVGFTSIFPACYSGRWPHIHFEVYPDVESIIDSANAIATSQVALPEEVCRTVYSLDGYDRSTANLDAVSLDSDNVFGDDAGALQLATVTGDATAGYAVSLTVRVDTATEPTGGSAPGGSDGAPSGEPGGEGGRPDGEGGAPPGGGSDGTPPSGRPGDGGAPPSAPAG